MKIVLPGERPISWNKFYAGKHWSVRNEEADRVHMLVRSAIDPETTPSFTEPVIITITAFFDKKPTDASNICGKLYEDALIGLVIPDDNYQQVVEYRKRSRLDRDNPRVEIEIELADSL